MRHSQPIAVLGMACRFPGADDPAALWHLLREGVDAISEVPEARWDVDQFYDPDLTTDGKMSTRWGGFIEGVEFFDAAFFGYSPREARVLDPQHRIFLETAWAALESAGYDPENCPGIVGVYAGMSLSTYLLFNLLGFLFMGLSVTVMSTAFRICTGWVPAAPGPSAPATTPSPGGGGAPFDTEG